MPNRRQVVFVDLGLGPDFSQVGYFQNRLAVADSLVRRSVHRRDRASDRRDDSNAPGAALSTGLECLVSGARLSCALQARAGYLEVGLGLLKLFERNDTSLIKRLGPFQVARFLRDLATDLFDLPIESDPFLGNRRLFSRGQLLFDGPE